jgi:Zn-dependent metalloprotease
LRNKPFAIPLFTFLALVIFAAALSAEKIGPNLVRDPYAPAAAPAVSGPAKAAIYAYLGREIDRGSFVLLRTLTDPGGIEHRRFEQRYEGLPVWGGEIIQHLRGGRVESYEGDFYRVADVDLRPKRTADQALESCRTGLRIPGLIAHPEETELVIYPVNEQDFRLAYRLTVERKDALFNEHVFVDAADGEVLFHYSLIQTEDPLIGSGTGARGNPLKFVTTLQNSKYYMWDQVKVRPITQRTYDGNHQYGASVTISNSADNTWAKNSIVNAHTNIGLCYDFYYVVFGNNGIDGKNGFAYNTFVHIFNVSQGLTDNAFFTNSSSLYGPGFYFLDPYYDVQDFAATIDVVAHEFSHGVTSLTGANLTYYGESGALNESFSDIFGTAIEFYFQEEGVGYNLADWVAGEDANPTFTYVGCRRLDDPNLNSQLQSSKYPDPCHISQKVPTLYTSDGKVVDNDNVHINCTIFPHLFYLLAHGGTNRVSQLSVTGIGVDKAQRIMWDAFVKRMTASTNFLGAANAILQSAIALYGSSSAEVTQAKNAIRAIGYTVN